MNAVEIEEAISQLAAAPFDPEAFPFAFLEAFGNKATTIKRLKATGKGSTNQSDLPGGVLQRNNIHLQVCPEGEVTATLAALRASPATARSKAKFILATDGKTLEAENLVDGETVACAYPDFADHFGFFLPLAGITTVRQIRENAFDIKATGRLNRLYVELLKQNPDWDRAERREEFNHFMARLIFCFFAEDTNIFHSEGLFTHTVAQMSASDASNTHEVLAEIFRAMSTPLKDREAAGIRNWANQFPYANGGLFGPHPLTPSPREGEGGQESGLAPLSHPGRGAGGEGQVPRFSKIARSYLLHVGNLDWTKINPDIFGSMIQAVADDEERGALGMHYTSVPNILKVLNPLFLDDLRAQLDAAGDNARKLLNLRQRLARIRVFDPACGSGNFLVIAYKEMRAIEAEINQRRGEPDRRSDIPLTNFRGIEIRHFSCEVARLALIIAEYQCNVLYRGPQLALAEFLPLKADNWITCGNALRLDWLSVCPPTGTDVKVQLEDLDLLSPPEDAAEVNFENEGGETYICGNPPYVGRRNQTQSQKAEIQNLLSKKIKSSASLDYVFCWIEKASEYIRFNGGEFAFVTTNSVSQGTQIPIYWHYLLSKGLTINFAHRSFRWSNNAANNAGVTCVILGIGHPKLPRVIFEDDQRQTVDVINPYLLPAEAQVVKQQSEPLSDVAKMRYGNLPGDGNYLTLSQQERAELLAASPELEHLVIPLYGAQEFIRGLQRFCLWIDDEDLELALSNSFVRSRIEGVRQVRENSKDSSYNILADRPHQFRDRNLGKKITILAPTICSENREFLPSAVFPGRTGTTNQAYAIYDAPLWHMALVTSRLHLVWIATVCGKLKTDFRYSNTLGWNTFPVPPLTEQNKTDLTHCAEDILLAREHYFPATIADMYDPKRMDSEFPEVRRAHERNDETLERIYIGRRFKNDTERLEKLFELYVKMTSKSTRSPSPPSRPRRRAGGEGNKEKSNDR